MALSPDWIELYNNGTAPVDLGGNEHFNLGRQPQAIHFPRRSHHPGKGLLSDFLYV